MTIENKLNQIEWAIKEIRAELKPEKSYAERQEIYLREKGIKVGSKVRVMRVAQSRQDGWNNAWVEEMDNLLGRVGIVDWIDSQSGVSLAGKYAFPFFVLEPVKEKVKKWVVGYIDPKGRSRQTKYWSQSHFRDEKEFQEYTGGYHHEFIGLIKSTEKEFEE